MIVWSDWVEVFTEQQTQEEIAGLILTPELVMTYITTQTLYLLFVSQGTVEG